VNPCEADAGLWFDKGVAWTRTHKPDDEELKSFRAEAGRELGIEWDWDRPFNCP